MAVRVRFLTNASLPGGAIYQPGAGAVLPDALAFELAGANAVEILESVSDAAEAGLPAEHTREARQAAEKAEAEAEEQRQRDLREAELEQRAAGPVGEAHPATGTGMADTTVAQTTSGPQVMTSTGPAPTPAQRRAQQEQLSEGVSRVPAADTGAEVKAGDEGRTEVRRRSTGTSSSSEKG